jgi:hypothetical protein
MHNDMDKYQGPIFTEKNHISEIEWLGIVYGAN